LKSILDVFLQNFDKTVINLTNNIIEYIKIMQKLQVFKKIVVNILKTILNE